MEIQLPFSAYYIENFLSGKITVVRIPKIPLQKGSVMAVKIPGKQWRKIYIGIKSIDFKRLLSITAEEAEQEGYISPDMCPSRDICANIETRIDLDSLVVDHDSKPLSGRTDGEIAEELDRRVKTGCVSCLIRESGKELFLYWWKAIYGEPVDEEIMRVEFEILTKAF